MHFPLKDPDAYFRINGDPEELGVWNKRDGPIKMSVYKEIKWLTGQVVTPWHMFVTFKQDECPREIKYKYSYFNDDKNEAVWEREPSRMLRIRDPNSYRGELGKQGSNVWPNVNEAWIVNGHIEKVDANFVGGLEFEKIGNSNIFIGPYPMVENDAEALAQAGVTAVFNVQTEIDIKHRGVNWERMC
jgi:hypothetical protein